MDLSERIDRIEAMLQIGQLVSRYAFAVDSRDFAALANLYVDDGRRAERQSFIANRMRSFYRTMHQICGHEIDLIDADHASGRVYTRAEHEQGDQWIDEAICYFDEYERHDGNWFFGRRTLHHLHVTSLADRPRAPFTAPSWAPDRVRIPDAWGESWRCYWENIPAEEIAALTLDPAPEVISSQGA
jgi:hypothetical protein